MRAVLAGGKRLPLTESGDETIGPYGEMVAYVGVFSPLGIRGRPVSGPYEAVQRTRKVFPL